jgi:hypothetical protein
MAGSAPSGKTLLKAPPIIRGELPISHNMLSIDQRRGIINLIPKQDKDLKYISNWRPISILNTDYKIITKSLANRLKTVLPDLINEDQNGFVMGRLIGQNIRIVKDVMDICEEYDIEGLLVMLDFEKAFDSLNWEFIMYVLKQYKFGDNFIRWVKILYTDISSSVANNGHISENFLLKRGIRQGCPLSAFVFILCAELLANKIRNCTNIKGLTFENTDYRILQFADDTALILNDVKSLKECLKILEKYYKCSGLRLNKKKTVVVSLGKGNNDANTELFLNEIELSLCNESFRYLGVFYHKNELVMEYKNFRHRLEKIANLLRMWLQRDLSLKGKITVLKTLALSQLIFPLSMLSAPKWVIEEADKLFLKFLWGNKPRKVKKLTTEKSIADGGLSMINIDYMARALKANWINSIYTETDNKWTKIPKLYFKDVTFEQFCETRFDERCLPRNLPLFYRQCLIITNELKNPELLNSQEVKLEGLWYNININIGREPVLYKVWNDHQIHKVGDLLKDNGDFLSLEEIQEKYSLPPQPFITYMSLRLAIPYQWKNLLTTKDTNNLVLERSKIYITLGDDVINISNCNNKMLYWQTLNNMNKSQPTSKPYWMRTYELDEDDMSNIYCLAFNSVRDTKIQSLQYKILNHIYACRLKLFQWRIKQSSQCLYCDSTDTVEHHFYICLQVANFWSALDRWWSNICNNCNLNNIKKVLFGVYNKDCHYKQLNFIILKGKWYISRCKYRKDRVCFLDFLPELKKEIMLEEMICRKNKKLDKYLDIWTETMEIL